MKLKFYSGLFETAFIANCPVQPIAISYFRNTEVDRDIAPYVDEDHFLMHLWHLLLRRQLYLQIDFLDEILPEKHHRRGLAQACHARISEVLETSAMIDIDYLVEVRDAGYVFIN